MKTMKQTMIYVGLNDADSHVQIHDTDKYVSLLKKVCFSYHIAFSMNKMEGGYFHEDGTFVEENTLVLTLLDADKDTVKEIAQDLCVFFHQESVMVTDSLSEVHFVKASLE